MSEQAQPAVLRKISKLLTLLRTLVFEPEHILKMMNHLMNEHRYLGWRAAGPPLGQIDGSGGVVIDGYGVVLSRRGSIVRLNLCSWIGQQVGKTQRRDLGGRCELYPGMLVHGRKVELI